MALTDNRTQLQDCQASGDVSADSDAAPQTTSTVVGTFIESTASVAFQVDDAQEHVLFDQDSASATFNVDMSDMTLYMMIKFGTGETFANLGGLICLNDGAAGGGGDDIGYAVTGADVVGLPYEFGFSTLKLDVSVVVAAPGTDNVDYFTYNGTEAGLNHAAVLQVGFGSFSLVKAVSTSANAWIDGIYYIANDSYAVSIIGGTVGTPETMTDVVVDDVAVGMGLFNNPKGSEFGFYGPTEWGAATGDTYFTSTGEQWYFIGDNQGGHAIGATHFPMRLLGGTGTNSWVISSTVMVNTGTLAAFDMSHSSFDTATMDGCSMIGFGDIALPNAGTAKTTLSCIFSGCGNVTSNGGDMTGSSVLTPAISANTSGLIWNLNQDPTGELDDMTFTKTSGLAHHAIEFGTAIPTAASYTLNGCAFGTDFSATEDGAVGDETFHFLDTTGTITLNLVGCTGNFGYRTEGVAVTIVADPATTKFTLQDSSGAFIDQARVLAETADNGGGSGFPYQAAVTTLTSSAGTATLTASAVHGLDTNDYVVIRGAQPDDYNKQAQITVTTTTAFEYSVTSGISTPATGTPVFSYAPISGLTATTGIIQSSKVWPASQGLIGWARKSTTSPYYKQTAITVSDASGGTDQTITLQSDE